MAPKKKTRKTAKPVSVKSKPLTEKNPEYMIQVSDPKMLRKDILESLREVIIFMQGYEKFRKIQEEKVALFSGLKISVRELNSLLDHKLRGYLPKGKLKPLAEIRMPERMEEPKQEEIAVPSKKPAKMMEEVEEEPRPRNDLTELESQLNEIERELKKIG